MAWHGSSLQRECPIVAPKPLGRQPYCALMRGPRSLSRAQRRVDPFGLRLLSLVTMAGTFYRRAMAGTGFGRAAVIARRFGGAGLNRLGNRCYTGRDRW